MKILKYLIFLTIPGIYLYKKGKVCLSFFIILIFSACLSSITNFKEYEYYSPVDWHFFYSYLISTYETTFTLNVSENDQSLRFHRPILPQKIEEYPYQKEIKIIAYILLLLIYFINFLIVLRGNKS